MCGSDIRFIVISPTPNLVSNKYWSQLVCNQSPVHNYPSVVSKQQSLTWFLQTILSLIIKYSGHKLANIEEDIEGNGNDEKNVTDGEVMTHNIGNK